MKKTLFLSLIILLLIFAVGCTDKQELIDLKSQINENEYTIEKQKNEIEELQDSIEELEKKIKEIKRDIMLNLW